jgi:hypothetical protein
MASSLPPTMQPARQPPQSLSLGLGPNPHELVIRSFAILLLLQVASASDAPKPFPLLGCWHTVSRSVGHGKFQKVALFSEEEFSKTGRWITHIGDGGYADGSYTFQPPDGFIIQYNYGDSAPTQRFTFRLDGNVVTLTAFPLRSEFPVGATNRIQSQSAEPAVFKMRRVKKLTFAPAP